MISETKFDTTDEECPQCGDVLERARYVRMVRSTTVVRPVGHVEGEAVDNWKECLECGHLNRDLADLPEGAREAWVAAWGNNR